MRWQNYSIRIHLHAIRLEKSASMCANVVIIYDDLVSQANRDFLRLTRTHGIYTIHIHNICTNNILWLCVKRREHGHIRLMYADVWLMLYCCCCCLSLSAWWLVNAYFAHRNTIQLNVKIWVFDVYAQWICDEWIQNQRWIFSHFIS